MTWNPKKHYKSSHTVFAESDLTASEMKELRKGAVMTLLDCKTNTTRLLFMDSYDQLRESDTWPAGSVPEHCPCTRCGETRSSQFWDRCSTCKRCMSKRSRELYAERRLRHEEWRKKHGLKRETRL